MYLGNKINCTGQINGATLSLDLYLEVKTKGKTLHHKLRNGIMGQRTGNETEKPQMQNYKMTCLLIRRKIG